MAIFEAADKRGNGQAAGSPGRGAVWGWASFDFAAQPFFTVVLTFVFGPYFVSQLAGDPASGQTAWAAVATLSGILVAVLSPLLGAIADRSGRRKRWIAVFATVKIAALCGLWSAAPGSSLAVAGALVVLASVAAEVSIVFNDALLPRLVPRGRIGLVSNLAWGLGYLGGMAALVLTLALLAASPETGRTILGLAPAFGLDPGQGEGARATAPLAALWYAVFLVPMFWLVPDARRTGEGTGGKRAAVRAGLAELGASLGELRRRPHLLRFMLARMIYADGVNGLLVLGGAFAAALFGWSTVESGVFGIVLVLAAILGCLAAGLADRRLGSKRVVVAAILLLVAATLLISSTAPGSILFGLVAFDAPAAQAGGLFASGAERATLLFGALVGLAFGPVQASSRALLAQSVGAEEAGRWFGLYAFTGRATSFLAPLAVALATAAASRLTDPVTASRIGISALILFFLAGLAILWGMPDPREDAEPRGPGPGRAS